MANVTNNTQDLKELVKAKIDSFEVEELESRLEMEAWFDDVNVVCENKAAAEVSAA
ncbi:MAG: hypothetical protein ACOVO2_11400 [Emticicia sp.]|uniref:hypothetical protein n=1 Tax=Emticicia sp. TaxID=1930953 RepID=UPI003BA5DD21